MSNIKKEIKKNGEIGYKAHIYLGIDSITGKQRQTVVRGRTKKEVKDKIILKKNEFMENGCTTVKATKITDSISFKELYELWRAKVYDKSVESSTLQDVISMVRNHLLPFIGNKSINSIEVSDVQEILDHLVEIKYTNVNKVRRLGVRIYKFANKHGYSTNNPFYLSEIQKRPLTSEEMRKKKEKEQGMFYTMEEVKQFLKYAKKDAVEANTLKWYCLYHLLFASGLRLGEITALTWEDIDFVDKSLSVNKALSKGAIDGDEHVPYLKAPKSLDSYRTIHLPEGIVQVLSDWKKEQVSDYVERGLLHNDKKLVFQNTKNAALAQTTISNRIHRFTKKYGLKKITPHLFRHTYSTILYQATMGGKEKERQNLMGHATAGMTLNVYTHASEEEKRKTVEILQDIVNL